MLVILFFFLLSTVPCTQVCVVKVNRVESNTLGIPNKECFDKSRCPLSPPAASSVNTDLKSETASHFESQHISGSGVSSMTPEGLRHFPETAELHPRIKDSQSCVTGLQDPLTSQDSSISVPSSPGTSTHTKCTSSETEMKQCLPDVDFQTSSSLSRDDSLSQKPNANSCMDTCTEIYTNNTAVADNVAETVDPIHISPHSTKEALYDIKSKPAEGDSCTSCGSISSPGHSCHSEKSSEEPPLLQRNAVEMPLLTLELADKIGICPLPPVLTQEMPALTPADDGLIDAPKTLTSSYQVAPLLHPERTIGSLSSHDVRQGEKETEVISKEASAGKHDDSWHLDSQNNCEAAGAPRLEGDVAHLTANATDKKTSCGVQILIKSQTTAEKNNSKLRDLTSACNDATSGQLLESSSPHSVVSSRDDFDDPSKKKSTSCVSTPHSFVGSTSNNNFSGSPPSLSVQSDRAPALEVNHLVTYSASHCSFQNPYVEPKPFSSSIWKNLSSQSPAVLIQSLNSDLPSDFTHDPLPYTMWTEPQCKEVTNLEDCDQKSANQEEESGPLIWAQLEPTSLVSVGATEPLGIGELQKGNMEGTEALALYRELGRQKQAGGSRYSDANVLGFGRRRVEQDVVSDTDEEEPNPEEEHQQNRVRGESCSDSSDEDEYEEEENDTVRYGCDKSNLEPGEVCAVSVFPTLITSYRSGSTVVYLHRYSLPFNTLC